MAAPSIGERLPCAPPDHAPRNAQRRAPLQPLAVGTGLPEGCEPADRSRSRRSSGLQLLSSVGRQKIPRPLRIPARIGNNFGAICNSVLGDLLSCGKRGEPDDQSSLRVTPPPDDAPCHSLGCHSCAPDAAPRGNRTTPYPKSGGQCGGTADSQTRLG